MCTLSMPSLFALPPPHTASRLQAALSGAQAARKEMERLQTVSNVSAGGAEAEARSVAARLAEAQARGSTLARQLETERQQGAAVAGALRDELQGIKVRLGWMRAREEGGRL